MAGTEGFSTSALVAALRKQVTALEDDLRARVDGTDLDSRQPGVFERWKSEYEHALTAQRTAASWQEWRNERVTQSAVAWVLLTVFARYCEDNALVSRLWIAGPNGDARQEALDARRAYFNEHPEHTDREWLSQIIEHFAVLDATKGLVDEFSPLHLVTPTGDAARALLEFWWQKDYLGDPLWNFDGVSTRFLGNAYQGLSDYAKKTYALLQTPEFVEEFILDQTLEPALAERPLEGFTVIDPTCGSGHFLLGAFDRLFDRWQREAPALGARVLVQRALSAVFGVDINPFAVAIARFRLMVAALQASGDDSIETMIDIELNLTAGDSLIWGARQQAISYDLLSVGQPQFAYSTEDRKMLTAILQREHDVVVGNPPYVSVKDSVLRDVYRRHFSTCHGKFVLSVPFMELFFDLAYSGSHSRRAGWIGKITSNAFMKRDYGAKLVENFLGSRDLRKVIDSEGAWIPGHNSDGTPTVILIGTGGAPRGRSVRAALTKGLRENSNVGDKGEGPCWRSIVEHINDPTFDNPWVSIVDLDREMFKVHPWSLSGGGVPEALAAIESVSHKTLSDIAEVGIFSVVGIEEPFEMPTWTNLSTRECVDGDFVRDYRIGSARRYWPYQLENGRYSIPAGYLPPRELWPFRTVLRRYVWFGQTKDERGQVWTEFGHIHKRFSVAKTLIAYAEIATHNHFVIDTGGKIFNQKAPVIMLPEEASSDSYLNLLGVLNSSVTCFWLREKCKPKGGAAKSLWARTYQFNSKNVKRIPLPLSFSLNGAAAIHRLSEEIAEWSPESVVARAVPSAEALAHARDRYEFVRGQMIAYQEELDWDCYYKYGLTDQQLTFRGDLEPIRPEERVFAIILASRQAGEADDWFADREHRFTPIKEVPARLSTDYKALLVRRLDIIAKNPILRVLEKPEYKRRWASEPWDKRVSRALRAWLLDRLEDASIWFDRDGHPTPWSIAQLADRLDRDEAFRTVLQLWVGSTDLSAPTALGKLLADEAVPFLAALRHSPSGLDTREAWEHVWRLQRLEDIGDRIEPQIPTPPKYSEKDYLRKAYWSKRGPLDVPKERFISYPGASRDSDPSELLGWAGWDHAEQALALAELIGHRVNDGWEADKLTPMLAGLAELAPWVRQWHGEIDPEYGESVADTIDEELRSRCAQIGVTIEELAAWRPPATTRGRGPRKVTTPA